MDDGYHVPDRMTQLMEKGVRIPSPSSVEIGDEVAIERISGSGVVLYGGAKLYGATTLICEGTELGYEAPVTVIDCKIGRGVRLKGGFFKGSTFLDGVQVTSGAHVREGCILEEEVRIGHTVGLKQTILFPYVTLGSLINFCDCLMSGGTDRKNHSEVGSSYIHFNYTPNQDKATASLIGDVPTGVMLDQPPIFLGGQGGLVGPVRIGHGTVIAAGTVYGKDCPEGGKLLKGQNTPVTETAFCRGLYCDVDRKVRNNIHYIANLLALKQWYIHVRGPLFQEWKKGRELIDGAIETLEAAIWERVKQFGAFAGKLAESARIGRTAPGMEKSDRLVALEEGISDVWPSLEAALTQGLEDSVALEERDRFLTSLRRQRAVGAGYVETMQALDEQTRSLGRAWLQGIVDEISEEALSIVPLCR
ncbi:MAG: UDP-N-acetylglucosamine pyrophosphorylase [Deltaproteobacteria bacterium]|nr:UDP-N-acetylglucosamine pyrophosphorylase [Deltaproteobacteria bacterium]